MSSSDTLKTLFLENAVLCSVNKQPKACQVLANLCVLHTYDLSNDACKLIQDITNQAPAVSGSYE